MQYCYSIIIVSVSERCMKCAVYVEFPGATGNVPDTSTCTASQNV